MNIYVGNLEFKVNERDLEQMFSEFGAVRSTSIIKDKFSGKSRGFGFVEMDSKSEGEQAIKALNGTTHGSRTLVVNEAKPKKDRRSNW
ncbi:MAG: RNA-binding protein [Bacteroidales bacterium]